MAPPVQYPYDEKIARKVREGIAKGVPVTTIYEEVQHYQNAPQSQTTFFRLYKKDIAEARMLLQAEIGDAVMKGVREGNPKLVEFAARARGGWNPTIQVKEMGEDDPDESRDALSRLQNLLGRDTPDED